MLGVDAQPSFDQLDFSGELFDLLLKDFVYAAPAPTRARSPARHAPPRCPRVSPVVAPLWRVRS